MSQQVKDAKKEPEFNPWAIHGGTREGTPASCLLTSTHMPWHAHASRTVKIKNVITITIVSETIYFVAAESSTILSKSLKLCSKTFERTDFSPTSSHQLVAFVSGGDVSFCFVLLKLIKDVPVCCTAIQGI